MIKYIRNAPRRALQGVALVRLDFNTEDEWRMRAALPTLSLLGKYASAICIVSHKGRPGGKEKALSLRRNADDLAALTRKKIRFIPHFRFAEIAEELRRARGGALYLLENIRFLKGETTPEPELARRLAMIADYYVNDAFAVSHREADSVAKVERYLPSYAGLGLEQEIKTLSMVMRKPKQPLVLILGGGKAHDKLGVISFLKKKAKAILLGGASANTLLAVRGEDIGTSRRDEDLKSASMLAAVARYRNVITPVDWRKKGSAIMDLGPKTEALYRRYISRARTILWSGPMGYIEDARFAKGNLAVAKAIAANKKAFTVAGGGETVMFLKKHRLDGKFGFISTGGGAMLEFLAGKKLPGIEALEKANMKSKRSKSK